MLVKHHSCIAIEHSHTLPIWPCWASPPPASFRFMRGEKESKPLSLYRRQDWLHLRKNRFSHITITFQRLRPFLGGLDRKKEGIKPRNESQKPTRKKMEDPFSVGVFSRCANVKALFTHLVMWIFLSSNYFTVSTYFTPKVSDGDKKECPIL